MIGRERKASVNLCEFPDTETISHGAYLFETVLVITLYFSYFRVGENIVDRLGVSGKRRNTKHVRQYFLNAPVLQTVFVCVLRYLFLAYKKMCSISNFCMASSGVNQGPLYVDLKVDVSFRRLIDGTGAGGNRRCAILRRQSKKTP